MRVAFVLALLSLVGCTEALENPDVEKVAAHQNWQCQLMRDNIQWELSHGVTADRLIEAIEACKHPKYKRGDVLRVKSNKNCTFKVYHSDVVYPDRLKKDHKITAAYRGREDCNGIIDSFDFKLESDLKRK